jgi:hypothetical protein
MVIKTQCLFLRFSFNYRNKIIFCIIILINIKLSNYLEKTLRNFHRLYITECKEQLFSGAFGDMFNDIFLERTMNLMIFSEDLKNRTYLIKQYE